ncbi:isochorismatase [Altererythrobacter sp. B11]|uniref:isochorismatase family cysteine hydrolase n=1 Tax=Altererythrobacter sp. B11 TaxID=2060312 RepID=UPI000DC70E94|nr:isochorismatase family cysteine hydrolase [Altererythrobacter sp. B11]BBC72795.1 isochorismatase [Altererythrobacter sp. B11]
MTRSDNSPRENPTAPARDQQGNGVALLVIDMINAFDFSGAETMLPYARKAAESILQLRAAADGLDIPVIYVNDNFGQWHSEKSALVEHVGDRLIHPDIAPRKRDYFIIKPQFSGFYATNLQVLLPKLGVRNLILTGVATDICVLFTAADAYMRDYKLWVPADAVAAEDEQRNAAALAIIQGNLGAETARVAELALEDWFPR